MLENTENSRAIILYRVSTDRQDETLQVNVCQKFCKDHNMIIVDEYKEIDVSGFKTPLAKRVELLKILNRAEKKKDFDALVVYLYDRLGRREDETPSVVQNLAKNKVKCFDAHNKSEIKVDTHVDKLMSYMNSWTSEFESIKTSIRVKDGMAAKNMTQSYTGGTPPYGYKVVLTDQINNKGKIITKLITNEYESEVIKKIFELAVTLNYGAIKIAEYLNSNGYVNRPKRILDKENSTFNLKTVFFRSNSINRILHNSVYIGRKVYNKTISERDTIIITNHNDWKQQPYNEELRIIDDELFHSANELLLKRRRVKGNHVNTMTNSGVLFSGLAYCICGSKLKSDYSIKKYTKNNGDITISKTYRYLCMDGSNNRQAHKEKYNTSVYFSAKKCDDIIVEIIKSNIDTMDISEYGTNLIHNIKKEEDRIINNIKLKNNDIEKFIKTIAKFEELIDTAIGNDETNISIYTDGIKRNNEKIMNTNSEIKELSNELNTLETKNKTKKDNYENIILFKDEFDNADFYNKKVILANIVTKVVFDQEFFDVDVNL